MDFKIKAAEIFRSVSCTNIERALKEAFNAGVEKSAEICEKNDEVTRLRDGSRSIQEKTSSNVNGLAYAAGIRELKVKI